MSVRKFHFIFHSSGFLPLVLVLCVVGHGVAEGDPGAGARARSGRQSTVRIHTPPVMRPPSGQSVVI